MRVLLDHNVDRRLRRHLPGHEIRTTREMRCEELANGHLLREAAGAAFEAFLSVDKKIRFEQNLDRLPLPVIVLDSVSNALPALVPFAGPVLSLLGGPLEIALYFIGADQTVTRSGNPSRGSA